VAVEMTELEILAEIQRLASMSEIAYHLCRKVEAQSLGIALTTLDRHVSRARRLLRNSSNPRTGSEKSAGGERFGDRSNGRSNAGGVRTAEELYQAAKLIIESPDALDSIRTAVKANGYAGDPNPVLLIYLALTSRLLDKPINLHVIAPSAAGKNFAINAALRLVPEESVFKMTAATPKALIYGEEDLRHRVVVLSECDSLLNLEGNAASLVRSIIEEARTDFDTVEEDPETNRNTTRRVTKEGPTGLITSGVRDLEFQTSTRVLNLHLSDSSDQTRAILKAEAELASGKAPAQDPEVIERLIGFQRYLAAQPNIRVVVVPFASVIADMVPAGEVRMRRDFKQLLGVIKTIALLNQHHRERDSTGAVLADWSDFRWARELLLSSFRSIVAGGITDAIRKTCEIVPDDGTGVSEADLMRQLGLAKGTIHYRVTRALKGGWLANLEHRRGYPYRLVRGAPLPEDESPLPTVEQLRDAFEQSVHSNVYSNSPQPTGAEEESPRPFKGSNDFEAAEFDNDQGIDIYPEDDDLENNKGPKS
jgi:hypothetical protein